ISDPGFVQELPRNSWGGAAQALTALRAPRWFEHYGKGEDLRHLMTRWVEAILASPVFAQQINPWTGEFIGPDGYSPAMLVFVSFVDRLGILKRPTDRERPRGDRPAGEPPSPAKAARP
ncbi:MAG: hypothetical protein HY321_02040, partial [Armatimonadetes bacterium]|nr:hypothetical protein [Armatimonadota bacterium]